MHKFTTYRLRGISLCMFSTKHKIKLSNSQLLVNCKLWKAWKTCQPAVPHTEALALPISAEQMTCSSTLIWTRHPYIPLTRPRPRYKGNIGMFFCTHPAFICLAMSRLILWICEIPVCQELCVKANAFLIHAHPNLTKAILQ